MKPYKRFPRQYNPIKNKDHIVSVKLSLHLNKYQSISVNTCRRDNINIFIKDNRDDIVKMYNNNEYTKTRDLLSNLRRGIDIWTDSYYCFLVLSDYCIVFNDLELFRIIVQQNKSNDKYMYQISFNS